MYPFIKGNEKISISILDDGLLIQKGHMADTYNTHAYKNYVLIQKVMLDLIGNPITINLKEIENGSFHVTKCR